MGNIPLDREDLHRLIMTTITIPTPYLDAGEPLFNLGLEALVKGAQPTYDDANTYYPIEDKFLDPATANQILAFPNTAIDNYFLQRYLAVAELSTELPTELPDSTVEDEEGNSRQMTWQEVQDLPTVNVSPRSDGFYYMNVTAHIDHRGLTLDEYNTAIVLPLLTASELPKPASD